MKKIVIASGPVIIENGKVLLDKHGEDDFWKFPGGAMDDFSLSLEDNARKEFKEEMSVEFEIIKPLRTLIHREKDKIAILVHYLAKRKGEIKPGKDLKEWGWFAIDNLPEDAGENVKEIVRDYLREK